jgi:hypothetical protein
MGGLLFQSTQSRLAELFGRTHIRRECPPRSQTRTRRISLHKDGAAKLCFVPGSYEGKSFKKMWQCSPIRKSEAR